MDTSIQHAQEELTLGDLMTKLWEGRWWLVSFLVLAAGLGTAVGFLTTPVYRATTVLVPTGSERTSLSSAVGATSGSLGALASLAGVGLATNDSVTEEALAVLRSREFAERFITDNDLLPVLFASEWDSSRKQWKVPPSKQPTLDKAYKYFNTNIRAIEQDNKTGIVTLQMDWKDRAMAAAWANELVRRLNQEMRQRAISQAEASLGYLSQELNKTTVVDTRDSINRLIETQINRRMIATVTTEYAFRVVDPAVVVDKDDVLRPRKILLIAFGAAAGLLLGVIAVLAFRR